ncbi:MAG TPA: hypothetical protein PLA17_07330, partial [Bacteroidales bacterium]|nr:hypothetical protein [Bacteroidales bacterium]
FSELIHAKESYMIVTLRNLTFFRRNVEYFFPLYVGSDDSRYLPIGTNYLPSLGFSYSIKF